VRRPMVRHRRERLVLTPVAYERISESPWGVAAPIAGVPTNR
jgi:hypothetical protein